jgi:hypothetical protein
LETESIFFSVHHCWLTNTEQKRNPSSEIHISRLGPQCGYNYFPKVTTEADLFTEAVAINYRNLMKIGKAVFEEIIILYLGANLRNQHFLSWNAQIYWALT